MLTSKFRQICELQTSVRVCHRLPPTGGKSFVHPLQEAAMKERCLLVDKKDNVIAHASKKYCHTVQESGFAPLHRAFSVYLFNNNGDLLIQKRSSHKITYPNYYSNSCCSHPLAYIPGEEEQKDGLGVKRAAQRRLNFELGIPLEEVPLEKIYFISRYMYADPGDGKWGENEIVNILFVKGNFTLKPNENEISEIKFIPHEGMNDHFLKLEGPFAPWMKLMLKYRLKFWWKNLDDLKKIEDHETINNFINHQDLTINQHFKD